MFFFFGEGWGGKGVKCEEPTVAVCVFCFFLRRFGCVYVLFGGGCERNSGIEIAPKVETTSFNRLLVL